jgi:hypothetical protein
MTVVDETPHEVTTTDQSCQSCRMIGTTVCLGVSGHLVYTSCSQRGVGPVAARPLYRVFVLACAGGFAALGVARALVD